MGIVFRQSVKTTIVTFTGALLGAVVIYVSTHILTQQQYGFSRNLLNEAVIGSQLILMGLHSTLYVYVSKYPPGSKGRSFLITLSVFTPLVLTVLFGFIFLFFKSKFIALHQTQDIGLITKHYAWIPLYALLWGWFTLLEQYLSSQMKIAASVFVREIFLKVLNIGLLLLFFLRCISFDVFVSLSVLVHIIPIGILFYMCRKTTDFRFSFNWKVLSRKEIISIFDFAIFHSLLNVSISLLGYVDALMVGTLDKSGMASVATYSIAVFVISIYNIPYRSMVSAASPMLTQAYEEKDMPKVYDLFSRSCINVLIVSIAMAAIIICNMHNAVSLLGPSYEPARLIVYILLVGRIIDVLTGMNDHMLSISNHYRFNFYITICLVVLIVVSNMYLIPRYSVYGAAISMSMSFSVYNITKMLFLWRKMKLMPLSGATLKVLLAGVAAVCAGLLVPYAFNPIIDTMAKSMVILAVFGILILVLKPSADVKNYLDAIRKNKKLF